MKTNNLIIICAWAFLIVLWILSFLGGWDLFWPFILFFIVIMLSVAVSTIPGKTKSETEVSEEIREIKEKIEATAQDVEEIKRLIEE